MKERFHLPPHAHQLIVSQRGCITRQQAHLLGISDRVIDRLVRDGVWQILERGTLVEARRADSIETRRWAGVLVAGDVCALGGSSALNADGMSLSEDDVTVVIPRQSRISSRYGYMFLRDGCGRLEHRRGTLPRIRPEDAILDCAATQTIEQFVGMVTDAQRLTLTTPRRVALVAQGRRRLPRRAALVAVLDDLQGIESNLEFVFRRDVERAHRLPAATRQFAHRGSRFDALYEPYGVVAEVDGRRGHLDGRFRDFERDNRHATTGLITLRYGSYDVRSSPCDIARQVAAALALRGWEGTPRPCRRCRP